MPTIKHGPLALAVLALAAALSVTACGSSSSSAKAHASGAASSALANPTVSNDLNVVEQELLSNLQRNFQPTHPVKSVETAVQLTFPKGNTAKISKYAVQTFTISVLHTSGPGSARDTWLQGVVAYAESQGAGAPASTTPPALPSSGQASIPGLQPSPSSSTP